jgi:membrane protease YdiL (CAAX protease family)
VNAALLAWYVVPAAALVAGLHGRGAIWRELGLARGWLGANAAALLLALPMLAGYGLLGTLAAQALPSTLVDQLRAALREEIFYRGFLFGQLFRHGGWGFAPAVAISSLVFAARHLAQAATPLQGLAIFGVTLAGGVWFAWLFVEWGYNLWIAIGLHWWMNVAWEAFAIGATAFSGAPAVEALRAATVLASVGWTAAAARRRGGPRLARAALWRHRPR